MSKQRLRNAVRRTLPSAITIVVVALMLAGFRVWAMPAADPASTSAIAGVVSYQGYLTDTAGEPVSGSVGITFGLYTVPSGGTAVWTEAHTGVNAVPVSNGLFNVMLGGLVPIPAGVWSNAELFLGVQAGGDLEMAPREPVGMVPYALLAQRATGLAAPDGDPADALTVTNDGWLTSGSGNITIGGSLMIPDGRMCIDDDGECGLPRAGALRVGEVHGAWSADNADYVVSLVPDDGKVGIRTGAPQAELDVNGDINWSGDLVGFDRNSCFDTASNGDARVDCGSNSDRVCFLTQVQFNGDAGIGQWQRCRVYDEEGRWWVSAETTSGVGDNLQCLARCLSW
jgi:hypothetical protein